MNAYWAVPRKPVEDAGNGGSQAEVGVRGASTAGRISFRPEERLPGRGDGQAWLNRDFRAGAVRGEGMIPRSWVLGGRG